eukprot:14853522-Alexandrium_andersonii.AAC.1
MRFRLLRLLRAAPPFFVEAPVDAACVSVDGRSCGSPAVVPEPRGEIHHLARSIAKVWSGTQCDACDGGDGELPCPMSA